MTTKDKSDWRRVADVAELPPGALKGVGVPGTKLVLVLVNVDGEIHAVGNDCPHREGPLSTGRLVHGELECPWHRFRFDPATGAGTVPDAFEPLPRYPVRVVDGGIELRATPLPAVQAAPATHGTIADGDGVEPAPMMHGA